MKKFLILLLLFCSLFISSQASHMNGCEITWECLSNGKYVFTMKFFRDCNGSPIPIGTQLLTVSNHPTITSISMNYVFPSSDISPKCHGIGSPITCGLRDTTGLYPPNINLPNNNGATEEAIFKSNQIK